MAHAIEISMDTSLACDLYLYNDFDDLDAFEQDLLAQLSAAKSSAKVDCTKHEIRSLAKPNRIDIHTSHESIKQKDCRIRLECSICLDIVQVPTATTCGHIYCRECIVESIQVRKKCPICATKISFRNIHPLYFN